MRQAPDPRIPLEVALLRLTRPESDPAPAALLERIERLEEEKAALAADIREGYAEAKGNGFDTKVMRQVLKLRKMDKDDRQEQEHLLALYLRALGMGEEG